MDFERKSSGVAKAGLATGITGASLGILNAMGGLGNILGANCNNGCGCNEDHLIDRYTLGLVRDNTELKMDKAFLESTIHTDKKSLELYQFIDSELRKVREELCDQKVINQKNSDSFHMVSERMSYMGKDFDNRINQECKERKCADNTIVTYANATFVPIQVAAYEVGTETYRQPVYNPLPAECCDC